MCVCVFFGFVLSVCFGFAFLYQSESVTFSFDALIYQNGNKLKKLHNILYKH